jgi:hypothetical protein
VAHAQQQWLVQAIRQRLLPALAASGFEALPLAGEDLRSPEIKRSFPFGRLRRPTPEGCQQIEIQFDKHEQPVFRLNFGLVPAAGIHHAVGLVAFADVWLHYMQHWNELYDSAWRRRWFGVAAPAPTAEDYLALAERVVKLLPKVEAAFDEQRALPLLGHVRRVR